MRDKDQLYLLAMFFTIGGIMIGILIGMYIVVFYQSMTPESQGVDSMYLPNPMAEKLFFIAAEKSGTEISPVTYGWYVKARNTILAEEVKECLGI